MHDTSMDELSQLITKGTEWRGLGLSVGVDINRIEAKLPDDSRVVLVWDAEGSDGAGCWDVTT